jgi:hypothetical protein
VLRLSFFSKICWCYDANKQDWCYATKKINVLLLFSIGGMIPEKMAKINWCFITTWLVVQGLTLF